MCHCVGTCYMIMMIMVWLTEMCKCLFRIFSNIVLSHIRSLNISTTGIQSEETKSPPSSGNQVRGSFYDNQKDFLLPYIFYIFLFLGAASYSIQSFFPFQMDDIFGSTGVNGKENGSSATASQPNRVWKQCHDSFTLMLTFSLFSK